MKLLFLRYTKGILMKESIINLQKFLKNLFMTQIHTKNLHPLIIEVTQGVKLEISLSQQQFGRVKDSYRTLMKNLIKYLIIVE